MIHVHWWLLLLAFGLGLGLTFMLIVRPLRRRAAATVTQPQPEWPSTVATATDEFFTAAASPENGSPPAETEAATAAMPAEQVPATVPAGGESSDSPSQDDASATVALPADVGVSTTRLPVEHEPTTTGGETTVSQRELATPPSTGEFFTTTPADDVWPQRAADRPTTAIPVGDDAAPATEVVATSPVADAPTTVIPAATEPPPKVSLLARLLRKVAHSFDNTATGGRSEEPSAGVGAPTRRIPAAKAATAGKTAPSRHAPARKVPPAKGAPARKAPPAKGVRKAPPAKGGPAKAVPPAKLWPDKRSPAAGGGPAKKVPAAKASPTQKNRKLPFEPFGPGSARATADGGGPAGWLVKGRTDTRLYYTPNDAAYDLVVAQVWFRDERYATRALFTPWCKSSRNR